MMKELKKYCNYMEFCSPIASSPKEARARLDAFLFVPWGDVAIEAAIPKRKSIMTGVCLH